MTTPIRLLGGVEIDTGAGPLDLGPAKQRAVLAVLLLADRPLTADELVARVWDADAPAGARSALRAYVCRLRAAVAATSVLRIERSGLGYRAACDPEQIDLARFRRLVRDARRAADGPTALAHYTDALALWRGDPLPGVSSAWLDGQRDTLRRERRCVELDHNDLALAHFEHGRILATLTEHAAAEPFDERVTGQLMLALRASGRASEALTVYDRMRRRLRDELGTEPGAELRDIHRRVLRADDDGQLRRRPPQPAARSVPRQLPPTVAGFVERTAQRQLLDRALLGAGEQARGEPRLAVLSGTGGAGKTSLALRWAHEHADAFPDGQLFVDLQGFDPDRAPLRPETALHAFVLALGADPSALPADRDALCAMYRTMSAGRRLLVVADNARDSAQVRPLLPAGPGSATLITSRSALSGVVTGHGARLIDVGMFGADQARALLGSRLGAERIEREPESVDALVRRCAGLPLALAIAAGRAALTPHLPLAVLADELADDATALDGLHTGEPGADVRTTMAVSVAALPPATAAAFGLIGLSPAPALSLDGVAAITGLARPGAAAALRHLTAARLVEHASAGRYAMHDLVRLYAADLGRADPQAPAAIGRLLQHYLDAVAGAEPTARRAFVATEARSMLAAIDLAFAEGHAELGCDLAVAIEEHLGARGCWDDVVRMNTAAVAAADRTADQPRLVRAHVALGRGLIGLRDFPAAATHLDRALGLAARLADTGQLARAHRARARLAAHQRRPAEALRHDRRALRLHLALGDRLGEATAYNAIGWHLAHLDRPEPALEHCRRALTIFEKLADPGGQAMTLDSIGLALELLGRPAEAQDHYQRSAQLDAELGWHVARAETLRRLERCYLRTGQPAAAQLARDNADDTLRQTGRLAA